MARGLGERLESLFFRLQLQEFPGFTAVIGLIGRDKM
jgi:hypothetical protein